MSETNPSEELLSPEPLTPKPARRRRPFGVFGMTAIAAAVVIGVWTAYWLAMSDRVRGGIDAWIDDQAAKGIQVSYESLDVEGYPFWLDVRMSGVRVAIEGESPTEWRPPFIHAKARPWNLAAIEVDLTGAHEVVGARSVTVTSRRLIATVNIGRRGAVSGVLAGEGLAAEISRAGTLSAANLAFEFAWQGHASDTVRPPLRIDLGLDGVALPEVWASPLGSDVETVRLIAHVTGRLGHPRDPDLLKNWRDDGGTLEVSGLSLNHGPLRLEGSGTIALDQALQPMGAFTVRAEGFMETVDALQDKHVIGIGEATAVKLVLTVLATRPAGKAPRLEAPLTLQDRELSLKSLPLMKLPRLDWRRILGPGAS